MIRRSQIVARARRARQVLGHFGPGWVAFRVSYMAQQRLGLLRRRTPAHPWAAEPLAGILAGRAPADPAAYLAHRRAAGPAFLFDPAAIPGEAASFAAWDAAGESPVVAAEAFAAGRLRYFSGAEQTLGAPPDWLRSPISGAHIPADRHWSQVHEFGQGDIKQIWEPSRFGFVFELLRAYARGGDGRYAELFWRAVESWRAANPPNRGPNWRCGQETSLRAMALCFGFYGFLHDPATTPARAAMLAELMAVSARRIAANLAYALSQRNNHGVSEGTGLFTIGALFPELRGAAAWETRGRQVLEDLARDLIDDDGGFAQHSANYQRLALHDYLWAIGIAERQGRPLSAGLRQRVLRAAGLLYQIQDDASGRLPVYGQNDGALILRLSPCAYDDYRPLIQAAHAMLAGARAYPPGPWDEEALWLAGAGALELPLCPPPRQDLAAPLAGLHTLRGSEGFAFTHCGAFRERPGHADLLHVDLWWRGQNVAVDAGTYSYNAPVGWDSTLGESARHNTATVDGLSQMDRAGRFLWLPWAAGRATCHTRSPRGLLAVWEGRHDGYRRLADPVTHRRAIVQIGDVAWLVIDRLDGERPHTYRLHWHLPDWPHTWDGAGGLDLATPAGAYALRAITLPSPPRPLSPSGSGGVAAPDGAANPQGSQHHRETIAPSPGRGGGRGEGYAAHGSPAVKNSTLERGGAGGGGATLFRAAEDGPRGWRSTRYGERQPALELELAVEAAAADFATLLGPGSIRLSYAEDTLLAAGDGWQALVTLRAAGEPGPLVRAASLAGPEEDLLYPENA